MPDAFPGHQDGARARHWQRRIALLAAEINAGWWLSCWLPWMLAVGLAGTFALLWTRWRAPEWEPRVWLATWGAVALSAGIAWWQARPRFESIAAARVLLEDRLGLHARLSSAAAGVGSWPERRIDLDARWPIRFRWRDPLLAILLVGSMLTAATIVPVADADAVRQHVIERPADAEAVAGWVDRLRRERAIDESSAADLAARIESLLERPSDTWYEHATLEASATLREQTTAELAALAKNLAAAARAAADLSAEGPGLGKEATERAGADLAAAAADLARGGVRPAGDAARELGTAAPDALAERPTADLAALADALRGNRARLVAALAAGKDFDLSALGPDADGLLADGMPCDHGVDREPCGDCRECREGKPCRKGRCARCAASGAGRGGLSRGPGVAPMRTGDEEDLGSRRRERIEAPTDVDRAAAGDLLAVVDGDPSSVTAAAAGPEAGGSVTLDGDAGGPSRVDNLLPREQDAVRRFFK